MASSMERAVGEVVQYHSSATRRDHTAYIGMVIFMASWLMLFAGLFFAYGMLRVTSQVWPPMDAPPMPVGFGMLNTLVIGASSAILHVGFRAIREDRARHLAWGLVGTLVLGAVFTALQVESWLQLSASGLLPSSGPYGSVFYALTVFHAAHVVVGLFALGVLAIRAFLGAYSAARHTTVRLWTMYWHFVGVVWLFLFLTVYVV